MIQKSHYLQGIYVKFWGCTGVCINAVQMIIPILQASQSRQTISISIDDLEGMRGQCLSCVHAFNEGDNICRFLFANQLVS